MKFITERTEIASTINFHKMPVVKMDLANKTEYGIRSEKVLIDNGTFRDGNPYYIHSDIRVYEDEDPCVIMKMDDLYAMQKDMIDLTDAIDLMAKYYVATKYQAPVNKQNELSDNSVREDIKKTEADRGDPFYESRLEDDGFAKVIDGKYYVENRFPCNKIAVVQWAYIREEESENDN